MKKINNFHIQWSRIDEVMHDMKSALTVLAFVEEHIKKARKKIGDSIDVINESINDMVGDKEEK